MDLESYNFFFVRRKFKEEIENLEDHSLIKNANIFYLKVI